MARIVVITHMFDNFQNAEYLLRHLIGHWIRAGHQVLFAAEPGNWPEGDIAILHVDLSVVPAAYAEAGRHYPVVVNGAALDIRKRLVSRQLVSRDDGWSGPVIVKTDLNCGGARELRLHRILKRRGLPDPARQITYLLDTYPIVDSAAEIPGAVWDNPGLVVERFLPEQDERGFWMRTWIFLGGSERCTRLLATHPVVKSSGIIGREPASVPDEMRAERARLGFDYGKFDFVVRDGKAILLDANRTPGPPPNYPELEAANAKLAQGLDTWLKK